MWVLSWCNTDYHIRRSYAGFLLDLSNDPYEVHFAYRSSEQIASYANWKLVCRLNGWFARRKRSTTRKGGTYSRSECLSVLTDLDTILSCKLLFEFLWSPRRLVFWIHLVYTMCARQFSSSNACKSELTVLTEHTVLSRRHLENQFAALDVDLLWLPTAQNNKTHTELQNCGRCVLKRLCSWGWFQSSKIKKCKFCYLQLCSPACRLLAFRDFLTITTPMSALGAQHLNFCRTGGGSGRGNYQVGEQKGVSA